MEMGLLSAFRFSLRYMLLCCCTVHGAWLMALCAVGTVLLCFSCVEWVPVSVCCVPVLP